MDCRSGARLHQFAQEVGEVAGKPSSGWPSAPTSRVRLSMSQPTTMMLRSRLQAGAAHRLEEGGGVDQDGGAGGPLDPPDIVVRPQEIHRPSTCGQANGCAMQLTPPRRPGEAIVEGALRNREGRWANGLQDPDAGGVLRLAAGVEDAVRRPFHPSHLPARRGRPDQPEGFKVRLPIRGRKDPVAARTRKSCRAR